MKYNLIIIALCFINNINARGGGHSSGHSSGHGSSHGSSHGTSHYSHRSSNIRVIRSYTVTHLVLLSYFIHKVDYNFKYNKITNYTTYNIKYYYKNETIECLYYNTHYYNKTDNIINYSNITIINISDVNINTLNDEIKFYYCKKIYNTNSTNNTNNYAILMIIIMLVCCYNCGEKKYMY